MMNRYEKNVMKLMEVHEKIPKVVLITNVNQAILDSGIKRGGENKWVCQITGAPMGTGCTWFSKAKCRALNKMPVCILQMERNGDRKGEVSPLQG